MKLLDFDSLESINTFLSDVCVGDYTIKGKIDAYSCKHVGSDKKMSLSLEHEILYYLGQSSDSDPPSSPDFLLSTTSRKTLIYLVLTLNHMYPDYDFSFLGDVATRYYIHLARMGNVVKRFDRRFTSPLLYEELRVQVSPFPKATLVINAVVETQQFFREEIWDSFKQIFETYLLEASKEWDEANGGSSFLESLYKTLDEVVKLPECEIYSYCPDSGTDPLLEKGAIWSFSFFFYNRKMKRVVSFRCYCLSNLAADGFITDRPYQEEDGDIFSDMDM